MKFLSVLFCSIFIFQVSLAQQTLTSVELHRYESSITNDFPYTLKFYLLHKGERVEEFILGPGEERSLFLKLTKRKARGYKLIADYDHETFNLDKKMVEAEEARRDRIREQDRQLLMVLGILADFAWESDNWFIKGLGGAYKFTETVVELAPAIDAILNEDYETASKELLEYASDQVVYQAGKKVADELGIPEVVTQTGYRLLQNYWSEDHEYQDLVHYMEGATYLLLDNQFHLNNSSVLLEAADSYDFADDTNWVLVGIGTNLVNENNTSDFLVGNNPDNIESEGGPFLVNFGVTGGLSFAREVRFGRTNNYYRPFVEVSYYPGVRYFQSGSYFINTDHLIDYNGPESYLPLNTINHLRLNSSVLSFQLTQLFYLGFFSAKIETGVIQQNYSLNFFPQTEYVQGYDIAKSAEQEIGPADVMIPYGGLGLGFNLRLLHVHFIGRLHSYQLAGDWFSNGDSVFPDQSILFTSTDQDLNPIALNNDGLNFSVLFSVVFNL